MLRPVGEAVHAVFHLSTRMRQARCRGPFRNASRSSSRKLSAILVCFCDSGRDWVTEACDEFLTGPAVVAMVIRLPSS